MMNSSTFKRSRQPVCEISIEYLTGIKSRKQVKSGESSRKVNQPQVKIGTEYHAKTAKKGSYSKMKGKAVQSGKESKESPYDFDCYEAIFNSEAYQSLSKQHSSMKAQMSEILTDLKSEIVDMNREISKEEKRLLSLSHLRGNLHAEIDYLIDLESEIKLNNYELRCELMVEGGHRGNNFYDSQQQIVAEELDYEEMMELREQFGVVSIGYDEKAIKNMRGEVLRSGKVQNEEQCCICCSDLKNNDNIFRTKCNHVHHLECLGRWLSVKRQCPLCRCEIVLT